MEGKNDSALTNFGSITGPRVNEVRSDRISSKPTTTLLSPAQHKSLQMAELISNVQNKEDMLYVEAIKVFARI